MLIVLSNGCGGKAMRETETPETTVDREDDRPERAANESLRAAAVEAAYILEAVRT
jgi:hypothetical protein